MKSAVGFCQFTDAFNDCRPDNFSYDGLRALFDYLEDIEESCGTEIELDVIALCCEYTEYANLGEYNDAYNYGDDHADSLEDIEYHTTVIPVDSDSFIIQDY